MRTMFLLGALAATLLACSGDGPRPRSAPPVPTVRAPAPQRPALPPVVTEDLTDDELAELEVAAGVADPAERGVAMAAAAEQIAGRQARELLAEGIPTDQLDAEMIRRFGAQREAIVLGALSADEQAVSETQLAEAARALEPTPGDRAIDDALRAELGGVP